MPSWTTETTDSYNRTVRRPSAFTWSVAFVLVICAFAALIIGINWLTAFKGVDQAHVCVIKQGGPFDGRSVADVRQPGGGVKNIGIFNKQFCFPATQRNYIVSANPKESDSKNADDVQVPTLDATNVHIEGQALFQLTTDKERITDFYKKFGVRTFDGYHAYEDDEGWDKFLKVQFRPVLENSLREAIGNFNCTDLNNLCQYVTNAEDTVKQGAKKVANGQNIAKAQDAIQKALQADLNSTLGGDFFENIRFRLKGITFDHAVAVQITAAQAKRTEVATQKLEADRQVAAATGQKRVADQQALAIKAKAQAYKDNPAQVQIEVARALANGNIQVLGGNSIAQLGK